MDKKNLAAAILITCVISLIVGIITPQTVLNKEPQKNPSTDTPSSLLSSLEANSSKIALVNIEGAISSNSVTNNWSNEFALDTFLSTLEKIQEDATVKAVIIRINSPGGTVAASQDVYDAILRLRAKKPVVASMADVAASGGYYVASAADRIVAQKGTMTGSIGVIFNFVDVAELAQKIGVSANVIKSGKYKDAGSMYRKMSSDEKALFQDSIQDAYSQFVEDIEKARVNRNDKYSNKRDLKKDTLLTYADGRVFLGAEAYELGFVDKLGSQYDAQLLASEMAGSKKALPIVSYNKISKFRNLLMGLESRFVNSLKPILPFSFVNNSRPLVIWE